MNPSPPPFHRTIEKRIRKGVLSRVGVERVQRVLTCLNHLAGFLVDGGAEFAPAEGGFRPHLEAVFCRLTEAGESGTWGLGKDTGRVGLVIPREAAHLETPRISQRSTNLHSYNTVLYIVLLTRFHLINYKPEWN